MLNLKDLLYRREHFSEEFLEDSPSKKKRLKPYAPPVVGRIEIDLTDNICISWIDDDDRYYENMNTVREIHPTGWD